jgi:hypothetical protein
MINAKCHKKDCKGSWHSLSRECSPPLLATGSPRHLEDRFTFTAIIVPVPGENRWSQTASIFAECSPFQVSDQACSGQQSGVRVRGESNDGPVLAEEFKPTPRNLRSLLPRNDKKD